jgi:hypothetical protein
VTVAAMEQGKTSDIPCGKIEEYSLITALVKTVVVFITSVICSHPAVSEVTEV